MPEPSAPSDTPQMIVTRKKRFSIVWVAPIIAILAVAYMVYDGLSQRGPMLTLYFHDAEGIVAGKSALKFEGVEVGVVESVSVDVSTGRVTLRGRLDASAAAIASQGSQFWIQNPEIGLAGIASLDTLISGPYV